MEIFQPGPTTFLQLADTPDSYAGAGGKIVSVKLTADGVEFTTPSTTITVYTDTVSGVINSVNVTFTVTNTIATAYALFLANSSYQPGTDFTVSGTTITMTAAPDASLSGQPFWLLHS